MTSLSSTEIGSITYNLIENIPVGVSGLLINGFLPRQAIYHAENYTGDSIDVNSVNKEYQPAILDLTISQVLSQMEAQGLGTKSVKIGELSITKGMMEGTSKSFADMGFRKLNDLSKSVKYYQTG